MSNSLHTQIMNIPVGDVLTLPADMRLKFKEGHKAARHAAAELAIAAEAEATRLKSALQTIANSESGGAYLRGVARKALGLPDDWAIDWTHE